MPVLAKKAGVATRRASQIRAGRWGAWLGGLFLILAATPAGDIRLQAQDEDFSYLAADPSTAKGGTMLGLSYYGILALNNDVIERDIPRLARDGVKLLRVWATWTGPNPSAGSLVDCSGKIVENPNNNLNMKRKLATLLYLAKDNDMTIDLSFDVAEFERMARLKGCGTPTYPAYRAAVTNVAAFLRAVPKPSTPSVTTDFSGMVVIDVCNECLWAGADISDTSGVFDKTKFCYLKITKADWEDKTMRTWYQILRELIGLVRAQNMQGFFSTMAGGDVDTVKKGADYMAKVYDVAEWKRTLKPLVAPHFDRSTCPAGWAKDTGKRVGWMYVERPMLQGLPLYMQEENRMRHGCCENKTPITSNDCDTAGSGMTSKDKGCQPANNPCNRWLEKCPNGYNACEVRFVDFQTSLTKSRNKNAWAWVFHTDVGFGCNPANSFYTNLTDPVEKQVMVDLFPGDPNGP